MMDPSMLGAEDPEMGGGSADPAMLQALLQALMGQGGAGSIPPELLEQLLPLLQGGGGGEPPMY